MREADFLVSRLVADCDRAKQKIAMAADVFRERLHRDVHTVRERVEINSGGPGVVEHNQHAGLVRRGSDFWNILHFHRYRAWALTPNEFRILLQKGGDFAADRRSVKSHFDAKTLQNLHGEFAIRIVNALWNQNVIAGTKA